MTQRLKTAGLALAILVLGIGLTVAVTEYAAGADTTRPSLLTSSDVVQALAEQGVEVGSESLPAHHPLLEIAGTAYTAGSATIEVYVYPSVESRVADEQLIQRQLMHLQAFEGGGDQLPRVTSARNVLLLFNADPHGSATPIFAAARALISGAD
ncbi:MAG TPA: hypothetical protein VFV93_05235 [Thermomicrobiales bacterium]|nr:hypothetical protein [Thermomicrobiales bacterium]